MSDTVLIDAAAAVEILQDDDPVVIEYPLQGPVGQQGATGATGAQGPIGLTGQPGADGATLHIASGAPSAGLGQSGDVYFRTDTNDVYSKTGGSWGTPVGNTAGPQGPAGPTGPQGPAGADGVFTGSETIETSIADADWLFYKRASDDALRRVTRSNLGGAFATGTKMLFVQTAAPTGWTKDTTHNDKALRIVSGAVGVGGSVAFSTVFGKTATDGHTLTTPGMPAHDHAGGFTASGGPLDAPGGFVIGAANTASAGGGGSHAHGMDIRVQYVDAIIAAKD